MSITLMDAFVDYIKLYNTARDDGNSNEAIRLGKKIVEIADSQIDKQNIPESHREYYKQSANKIKEFLAEERIGRPMSFGSKNNSDDITCKDWFDAEIPNLKLSDIAGLKDVKDEFIVNVFAPLTPKYASIYKKYRKDVGLQVLLYGPPGTGKTHIVKCLAGQLGCKIAVVQIKDALAGIVGDGAKIISAVFEQAKKYDKCIIFFDEIDAIAANREGDESRYTKEQLTTLLTNMDGFTAGTKEGQIRIIIAATNRPNILDSAIKRGGRFDTQIYVPLPDLDARIQLVKLALVNGYDEIIPCASDVTIEWIAKRLEGYAGADIKAICKQIAAQPMKREITNLSINKRYVADKITREDCEYILGKYINPITDENLLMFDAYAANMEYVDYLDVLKLRVRKAREEGIKLDPHVERWFNKNDIL